MNIKDINEDSKRQWNAKAEFWDELHGDKGNPFHRIIVEPSVKELLSIDPDQRILDVACGNGALARSLSEWGGKVTAIDFSEKFIEKAIERGQRGGAPIDYQVMDATNEKELTQLGKFHSITSTMALMDMPVVSPFFRAAAKILEPKGKLVCAIAHPSFWTADVSFITERKYTDGRLSISHAVKVNNYLHVAPTLVVGSRNEPNSHYFYHRSLEELMGKLFNSGFVIDALREPSFPSEFARPDEFTGWKTRPNIPPALVFRARCISD